MYEGWKNHLIPASDMKEQIKSVSESRLTICKECHYYSENRKKDGKYSSSRPDVHCTNCGCTLAAKTKCLSCSCPMKYWKAIMTDDQYDEIRNTLEDGEG